MAKKRNYKTRGPKYNFGIRVPRNLKEAYELDKINGDTLLAEAIKKEVDLLYGEYECFKVLGEDEKPPPDYHLIPLLWVFAVKFDG